MVRNPPPEQMPGTGGGETTVPVAPRLAELSLTEVGRDQNGVT